MVRSHNLRLPKVSSNLRLEALTGRMSESWANTAFHQACSEGQASHFNSSWPKRNAHLFFPMKAFTKLSEVIKFKRLYNEKVQYKFRVLLL